MSHERSIFLVGFMGCGKTAVGRILAGELQRPFHDTDDLVERRDERTIETIFRDSGEGRFRELEWEALRSLGDDAPAVVACGGGLFARASRRGWIRRHGLSLWLDASLAACRARVGAAGGRPRWVRDDPVGLRALYDRRRAAYFLANLHFPVSEGVPADEIARNLAERLARP